MVGLDERMLVTTQALTRVRPAATTTGMAIARLQRHKRRGSTEPRRNRQLQRTYEIARRSCYFFFAAFFLAAGFFAAFFLAAMFVHLLLSDTDPRFHGVAISFSW
jgi:hypothetical protein